MIEVVGLFQDLDNAVEAAKDAENQGLRQITLQPYIRTEPGFSPTEKGTYLGALLLGIVGLILGVLFWFEIITIRGLTPIMSAGSVAVVVLWTVVFASLGGLIGFIVFSERNLRHRQSAVTILAEEKQVELAESVLRSWHALDIEERDV